MHTLREGVCGENGLTAELKPRGMGGDGEEAAFEEANDVLVTATGTGEIEWSAFGIGNDPTGLTEGFHVM